MEGSKNIAIVAFSRLHRHAACINQRITGNIDSVYLAVPSVKNFKVLVKCRQNVANKLFMNRVFNPVRLRTHLADSAKCSTQTIERSHMA